MEKIIALAADNIEEEGLSILRKAGFEVETKGKISPEDLGKIISRYDILVVRSGTKVPAPVLEKADRLKIIGRAGVGIDNVDVAAATAKGIIVMNAPEGNTVSAAEHTLGLLLSLARNIPQANDSMKAGNWERGKYMGMELFGKTIGIIGLGRIGRRVAVEVQALGMKVLGYDPFVSEEEARALNINLVTADGLCSQADVITLHAVASKETEHFLSEKQFSMMKDGAMIINTARGNLIDEAALIKYLKNGKLKGAAIDVFDKEPPVGSELPKLDNVIVTPHLGASTKEAQINVAKDICRQIVDALTKKLIKNALNLPTIDEKVLEKLKGYLSLSEKIGNFLSQLLDVPPGNLAIEYAGEITNYDVSPLRAYIIKGFMERFQPSVTYVNAPLLLREKGIKLQELKNPSAGEFFTTITLEAKQSDVQVSITGTVVAGEPRIVRIDGYAVEAQPEGHLLLAFNDDRPGLMGHIGTVLGKKSVNIASMTLGRKVKGGPAITVLNLDDGIDEQTITEIGKFPGIRRVKLVKL